MKTKNFIMAMLIIAFAMGTVMMTGCKKKDEGTTPDAGDVMKAVEKTADEAADTADEAAEEAEEAIKEVEKEMEK